MSTSELLLEGVRSLNWQENRTSLPLNTIIQKPADPAPSFRAHSWTRLNARYFRSLTAAPAYRTSAAFPARRFNAQRMCSLRSACCSAADQGPTKRVHVSGRTTELHPQLAESMGPDSATESLINRELLQNAYNSLDLQNYYEILSATPHEIKKTYTVFTSSIIRTGRQTLSLRT